MLVTVNYPAVLVSAVAMMALGFAWYSPVFFGSAWIRAMGWDPSDRAKMEEVRHGMGSGYATSFAAALVTAYILAVFIGRINPNPSWMSGLKIAILAWLGFVATIKFTDTIFSDKPRSQSKKLFLLNAGYQLVCFVVAGLILGVWK